MLALYRGSSVHENFEWYSLCSEYSVVYLKVSYHDITKIWTVGANDLLGGYIKFPVPPYVQIVPIMHKKLKAFSFYILHP